MPQSSVPFGASLNMFRRKQPRLFNIALIATVLILFVYIYKHKDTVERRLWNPRQSGDASSDSATTSSADEPVPLPEPAENGLQIGIGSSQNEELKPEDVFQNGASLAQDDPRLLSFIRKNHLRPPSPHPYKLKNPNTDPSVNMGIRAFVHDLLGKKKDGFFIECGGLDGEFYSNSLVLERDFGWTGLLVEADPDYVPQLIAKNRKSWFADVCLSLDPWPQTAKMQAHGVMGWSVIAENSTNRDFKTIEVKCIPLYSLLAALEVKTVDYFSLDIEGNELKVLKTIPFDKILIKTVSVETSPERHEELRTFMASKDYRFVKHIKNNYAHDDIFLHNSIPWADKDEKTDK